VIPALYFALSACAVVAFLAFWRTRAMSQRFVAEDYFAGEDRSIPSEPDYSRLELGPKIFDSVDSDFVARETSRHFARRFRQERTALALQWLSQTRRLTNRLMRAHAQSARANTDLRVKDEIALGLDFLGFQLVITILYAAVWLRGPFHAARLVGYSVSLGRRFQEMAQVVLPSTDSIAPETVVVTSEHSRRNRSAAAR
jgi:hypothetical protein